MTSLIRRSALIACVLASSIHTQQLLEIDTRAKAEGKTNPAGHKTGLWKFSHANGQPWVEGKYDDGKRRGTWKVSSPSGWVRRELEFRGDADSGYYTDWRFDPQLGQRFKTREGEFKSLLPHGIGITYYFSGAVSSKGMYEDGSRRGRFEFYDEFGHLRSMGTIENELYEGEFIFYEYKAGGAKYKRSVGQYVRSVSQGEWKDYHPNGKLEAIGKVVGGQKEGQWSFFHANGKLAKQGRVEAGKWVGKWKIFHRDGWLESEGSGVNTRREGPWVCYQMNAEGKHLKQLEVRYTQGYETGPWISYLSNGKVDEQGDFVLGLRHGVWKAFHPNGKLRTRTEMHHGKKNGVLKSWFSSGQLEHEERYVYGYLSGKAKRYREDGKLDSDCNYKKGQRDGVCRYWGLHRQLDARRTGIYRRDQFIKRTEAPLNFREFLEPQIVDPYPAPQWVEEFGEIKRLWSRRAWLELLPHARLIIARSPADSRGYAFAYTLQRYQDKGLSKGTRAMATQALDALQEHPLELVKFIDAALLSDADHEAYTTALMALTPIMPAARRIPLARIVYLKTLDGLGQTSLAIHETKSILDDIDHHYDDLYALAWTITGLNLGAPFAGIALAAVDEIMQGEPEREMIGELRYCILHDLMCDEVGSQQQALKLLDYIDPGDLNNWVWFLISSPTHSGRFDSLAYLGAQRMLLQGENPAYAYDTIAMAMYLGGRGVEAIRYQQKAIELKPSSEQYVEALEMLRTAHARVKARESDHDKVIRAKGK